MADLIGASKDEVLGVATIFAQAFASNPSFGSKGGGSSGGTGPTQEQKNKAEGEYLEFRTKGNQLLKKSADLSKKFNESFKQWINQNFSWQRALRKGTEDIKSNLTFAIEAGTKEQQLLSELKLGTTVTQINELNSQTRLVSQSMGGYNNWTNQLMDRHKSYYMQIGDAAETTKFMGNTLQTLADSGLKPSLEQFETSNEIQGKYGQSMKTSFDNLNKLGVTYSQSSDLLKGMLDDESVQTRLRGVAGEEERKAILQGLTARNQEFRQMGMNVEQIKKANAALDKMSGKGPMERFKAAAKAQASLTAMGIEGADKVAAFIRAGDRATEEERVDAAEVMGRAKDALAESRKAGMGEEMATDIIASKGGIHDMSDAFSTKLKEQIKVSDDQLKQMTTMATSTDLIDKGLKEGVYLKDMASLALENSAAVQAMGATLKSFYKWAQVFGPAVLLSNLGAVGLATLAVGGIAGAVQAIATGESFIHDALTSFAAGQWISDKLVGPLLHTLLDPIFSGLRSALDFVVDNFDSLMGFINESLFGIPQMIIDGWKGLWEIFKNSIGDLFNLLPDGIQTGISGMITTVKDAVLDLVPWGDSKEDRKLEDKLAQAEKDKLAAREKREEMYKREKEEAARKKTENAKKEMEEGVKLGNKELVEEQKKANQLQERLVRIQEEKWQIQKQWHTEGDPTMKGIMSQYGFQSAPSEVEGF